ncbi:hypothetical protein [Rhodococcus sp. BH5]|uniref:hypothetical protein n=1 Tax=Rhodococcus sp. BH5 TaxID=2871702 RepID=UPI0022CD7C4E|nr:hypothetical protein [Rhodococcus sp. BH5]MCZ9635185.1 hypothetical protein [Rhodococcus sp. BH5]
MQHLKFLRTVAIEETGEIGPVNINLGSGTDRAHISQLSEPSFLRSKIAEAVGNNTVDFYPIGDTPGLVCMAVGQENQIDIGQILNIPASAVLRRFGCASQVQVRGRALLFSGSYIQPKPLPNGVAAALALHLRIEISSFLEASR